MPNKTREPIGNFASKIRMDETTGCWNWISTIVNHYGVINSRFFAQKPIRAHRASWMLHVGPIPEGMFICHTCDNTKCVNPAHLFLGTPKDNKQDCMKKGRYFKGKKFALVKDLPMLYLSLPS